MRISLLVHLESRAYIHCTHNCWIFLSLAMVIIMNFLKSLALPRARSPTTMEIIIFVRRRRRRCSEDSVNCCNWSINYTGPCAPATALTRSKRYYFSRPPLKFSSLRVVITFSAQQLLCGKINRKDVLITGARLNYYSRANDRAENTHNASEYAVCAIN